MKKFIIGNHLIRYILDNSKQEKKEPECYDYYVINDDCDEEDEKESSEEDEDLAVVDSVNQINIADSADEYRRDKVKILTKEELWQKQYGNVVKTKPFEEKY